MKINFSAPITAADTETRIVAGQILPFGKPGNTSAGPVVFAANALGDLADKEIILNLEHDQSRPVGKSIELSMTPGGVYAKFKVAETTAGNDLLIEAAEGLRTGFSIEATVQKHTIKAGVMHVTAAELTACAAVTRPAYGEHAQITEVAAFEQPDEAEATNPSTEGSDMTDQVTSVEETAPAVEASAPTVQAAAAPIYTSPRQAPLTAGQYATLSIKAAFGDSEARQTIMAADDSTANNTGLTLPGHKDAFITKTFATRPMIDAIGVIPLTATGMSYTIPRMLTAPTVATTAEGGAPSETGMTSDYLTATVVKKSGLNRVSFELLERSQPNFGDKLIRELQKAYAKDTDEYAIAQLTAGGTAATATAGTLAGLQTFIADEAVAGYMETGGDYLTELVASGAWWSALIKANDSAGRPLFPNLAPQNAPGRASVASSSADVFGTNFRADQNIATVGLIDDSAFLIAPDAVEIAESPTTQLRVTVLTSGEVEIGLHGYIAVTVLKAAGVRRFNLI